MLVSASVPSQMERDATKIPTKMVWVSFAEARECKPGTVISGFKYGQVSTRQLAVFILSSRAMA
jgi:hypothetical protein